MIFLIFFIFTPVLAQPISTETWQLQQLIDKSEQQVRSARELIKYSQRDSQALEKAARLLQEMSNGIDKSIEGYKGTRVYEQALLQMQAQDQSAPSEKDRAKIIERVSRFRAQSLKANQSDLQAQEKLEQALQTAAPGFIPKLQAQAQLGHWQTTTRLSVQLAEFISTMQNTCDPQGGKDGSMKGLAALLAGSEVQNRKQRESSSNGLR
ncbi:MAG: hypothetical protein KF799_15145 [Bdellovibrionales bacterium]|nr:hypothetical protein [Bdellovibrionales bacterium]